MKKIVVFNLLLSLFNFFTLGQNDLSDIYSNKNRSKSITIFNDSLKLVCNSSSGVQGWILAECTFKWVADNFIEINSTPPYILLKEGMVFEEWYDSIQNDMLKISFSFPNFKEELDITISGDNEFVVKYPEKKEIIFYNRKDYISISILNSRYVGELDGSFYGFRYCSIVVFKAKKDVNNIKIEVPAIDNAFFMKYYIKSEYAKISNDTIFWKDEVFVKENAKQKNLGNLPTLRLTTLPSFPVQTTLQIQNNNIEYSYKETKRQQKRNKEKIKR